MPTLEDLSALLYTDLVLWGAAVLSLSITVFAVLYVLRVLDME